MDYLEKIKDKEEADDKLTKRMDADEKLLQLEAYVMKDFKGHTIPDIVNVTLNRPAVFFANVVSALGNTVEQVIVESNDEKIDTHEIEDFRNAGFTSANYRLRRMGRAMLDPFIDTQNCARGRSAARCLFRKEGDVLVPRIDPWDTRFVTYDMGEDGLNWAAYKMKRGKDLIEAEYSEELVKYKINLSGKTDVVVDVWDREKNEVWVAGKQIREDGHEFDDYVPVCIQIVPLGYGSILMGENRIEYEGESIFFLIRGAIPELNRLLSIMQTLNFKAAKPPMKEKRRGGSLKGEPSEYEDVTGAGTNTLMDIDEDIARIDYGDAQRSAQHAYTMIDKEMQEGSLSSIDLGTLQFQLSAVALIEIGEGRDQVFLPRLAGKGLLKEQLSDMFTEQVKQIGGTVELGTPGHKRKFEASKLEGEYGVTYKFFVKSPKIDMARHSVANAAIYVSDKYKRENMLQLEDPDGEEEQMTIEEAYKTSPLLRLDKQIRTLLERGMDEQAELLATEMGVTIDALMAGDISQIPKAEVKKPQQMINMFGEGMGGVSGEMSSAKKAAELQKEPRDKGV